RRVVLIRNLVSQQPAVRIRSPHQAAPIRNLHSRLPAHTAPSHDNPLAAHAPPSEPDSERFSARYPPGAFYCGPSPGDGAPTLSNRFKRAPLRGPGNTTLTRVPGKTGRLTRFHHAPCARAISRT